MRIYLAGSWAARKELQEMRDKLIAADIEVTSRWLDWPGPLPGETKADEWRRSALWDLADIDKAEAVLIVTTTPSTHGGFHTELGYAMGSGKPVAVIGPRPSNFFMLHRIVQFESVEHFIEFQENNR